MTAQLSPGFADPVLDSQRVFRAAMDALSHPGRTVPLDTALDVPAPLTPSGAALVLMLADFETTLWLDAALAAAPAVGRYLTFHSGVRLTDDPSTADFALVSDPAAMPDLGDFAQGTPDYPDRSTTLIVQVEAFGAGWHLEGPGIKDRIAFSAAPLAPDFTDQIVANRAGFPLGVDILFAGPATIAGLPRSTRLIGG